MTTSSDSIISALKKEEPVVFSTNRQSVAMIDDMTAQNNGVFPTPGVHSIVTKPDYQHQTVGDIRRNALSTQNARNYFLGIVGTGAKETFRSQLLAYYQDKAKNPSKTLEELEEKELEKLESDFNQLMCGHVPTGKQPEACVDLIRGFLSEKLKLDSKLVDILMLTLHQGALFDILFRDPEVMLPLGERGIILSTNNAKRTYLISISEDRKTINISQIISGIELVKNNSSGLSEILRPDLAITANFEVKLDDPKNEPEVFVEYRAAASGMGVEYAKAIIAAVTPKGQNCKMNGVDVNFDTDDEGRTALHRAVLSEDLNLVRTLLDSKLVVDINATDKQGKTALHYAAERNLENIVLALVDRGADCTIRDKNKKKRAYQYATATEAKPLRQFLKALTLVDGYLKHETDDVQVNKKIGIAQGLRECLVESVSCNPASPIAARMTNITNNMTDEENKKDIKKDIADKLKKPKHSVIGTLFGRLLRNLAKLLDLDVAKQSQDIIEPEDGESHGEVFCKKLSEVVLPTRQRSQSASAMFRYSLVGTGQLEKAEVRGVQQKPLLGRSQSCSSFFLSKNKVRDGRRETEDKQQKTSISPCSQRPLRYRPTAK